jgi:hypothetical protein
MKAVELETSIKGHRLDLTSEALPEQVGKARVIVLYEETPESQIDDTSEIDAVLERTRGILGNRSMDEIDEELAEMRKEWE